MKHPAQEDDVVPGRAIGITGLAVIAITIAGVVVAWALGRGSLTAGGRTRFGPPPQAMKSAPFSVEAQGLDDILRSQTYLSTYGWIDRDRQIIHVPIETAIELYLARRAAGAPSASAHRGAEP